MREVAAAEVTDNASADSAAQATPRILTQRTPGILCSPRLLKSKDRLRHSHDELVRTSPCERCARSGQRG